jgi:hypothetical protein
MLHPRKWLENLNQAQYRTSVSDEEHSAAFQAIEIAGDSD